MSDDDDNDFAYWQEPYKVDLPVGGHGEVSIRKIEIDALTSFDSCMNTMLYGLRGAVPPGTFTGLYRGDVLWMSDTPDEIADQMGAVSAVEQVGGRILVNGLGLGMFVKACLAFDHVEHIDVVEIDPDVVALVGPHYASERCTIHLADAYEIEWPPDTTWDVVWSDIWPTIDDRNVPEMERLVHKYRDRALLHFAWAEEECREMAALIAAKTAARADA